MSCGGESAAGEASVDALLRTEGASDPDDMTAVVGVTCPRCSARGTLVLGYGPTASVEDTDVLVALPDPPPEHEYGK